MNEIVKVLPSFFFLLLSINYLFNLIFCFRLKEKGHNYVFACARVY